MEGRGQRRNPGGLSSRPALHADPQETLQLRVDPRHGAASVDEEVVGLRSKVALLKQVASQIEQESKEQSSLLEQLGETMQKAQAALKNTARRLNRTLATQTNYVGHVIIFALLLFLVVYLWSKVAR